VLRVPNECVPVEGRPRVAVKVNEWDELGGEPGLYAPTGDLPILLRTRN